MGFYFYPGGVMAMLQWMNYESKYAQLVDKWLDPEAVAMTGLDEGWDDYWLAVREDAVNYPGCEDYCKVIFKAGIPVAVVCYGIYQNIMTISEIVVDPKFRGQGIGSRLLATLVELAESYVSHRVDRVTAVVYRKNQASQRAFLNAGFHLEGTTEDGVDLIFTSLLR